MNIVDQLLANLAILPGHYERSGTSSAIALNQFWKLATPYSTAANRYLLLSPDRLSVNINDGGYAISAQGRIDLSVAANWDNTTTDYTVAANRAGKDFYLYACQPITGINPIFILSANSTAPSGTPPANCAAYSGTTTRKLGGFHCLCADIGTISGHDLTGFVAGDILPASIWDLKFRPRSASPEGMVYLAAIGKWVDIYPASGTGTSTASVNGATISDTRTWNDFVDDGAAVKKRLLKDAEFQAAAAGSNEQTNIAGSSDPVTAGGHRDSSGTSGTSTSAGSPSTDISAATNPQSLTVALNGLTPVAVSFNPSGKNTGALIAAALQVAIRAAFAWAGGLTVTYGSTYVITSPGSCGLSASVVITAGTPNDCAAALKLGVANGGTEVSGTLGRRMISNGGCEDCAGVMYQWLDENGFQVSYDGTIATAVKTATITHAASPGGNPIYVKYLATGEAYLCCNMPAAAVDKWVAFGTDYKILIKHDADAATGGGLQVYFDEDATQPARLLAVLGRLKNAYVPSSNPAYFLQITYSAAAATAGVAVNYDDGADDRLEFTSPTTANGTLDLALLSQAFSMKTIGGSKGQLYSQGVYGDAKLLAGAGWGGGAACGSRARGANSYRWGTASNYGGRFAAEAA
jgi:hypothetical protein